MRTFERYRDNRLAKLRLGQAAGEIVILTDGTEDDEPTRFVVVPLTDGEYLKALSFADDSQAGSNTAGVVIRDEIIKQGILLFAAREVHDWTQPFFQSMEEVAEIYDHDVNQAWDVYLEMVANSSPSLMMLDDEEYENLKKAWSLIQWNELSGQQLYAARRFLNSIQQLLLQASLSGSQSTERLTQQNLKRKHAMNASQDEMD